MCPPSYDLVNLCSLTNWDAFISAVSKFIIKRTLLHVCLVYTELTSVLNCNSLEIVPVILLYKNGEKRRQVELFSSVKHC